MSLVEYRKKRNFSKTKEPKNSAKQTKNHLFVIQKHYARRLHFDLRLQIGKTLKSWAVPKGLPKTTKEKHLAILVEDHPLSYASFEGTIPKGEYGAGKVQIWDKGQYENIKHDDKGKIIPMKKCLKMGHIEFVLHGKKRDAAYALVHFKENNWLLIKMKKRNEEK